MNNPELTQKISQLETQTQNIKATLKEKANQIGKYHKALKEITDQLAIIKEKLNLDMKDNNKTTKIRGGKK